VAPEFILMHLMLFVAGNRKPCHQLKFLQLLSGNLEGKLLAYLLSWLCIAQNSNDIA